MTTRPDWAPANPYPTTYAGRDAWQEGQDATLKAMDVRVCVWIIYEHDGCAVKTIETQCGNELAHGDQWYATICGYCGARIEYRRVES